MYVIGVVRVGCSVAAVCAGGLHSPINVYAQLSLTKSLVSELRHRCSSSASPLFLMDGVLVPSLLQDPFEKGSLYGKPGRKSPTLPPALTACLLPPSSSSPQTLFRPCQCLDAGTQKLKLSVWVTSISPNDVVCLNWAQVQCHRGLSRLTLTLLY